MCMYKVGIYFLNFYEVTYVAPEFLVFSLGLKCPSDPQIYTYLLNIVLFCYLPLLFSICNRVYK